MDFCRQEHRGGLPCLCPGDLPGPGIEPGSPVLQVDSLLSYTEVGSHPLLQGIFPTLGSNPSLSHFRQILYCLSHQRSAVNSVSSVQFSPVAQSCPTLCHPMNRSTPGLPVHHQVLESTQTHVHRIGDAIQPSHPLSSPSPPALNLSQHQGLFK